VCARWLLNSLLVSGMKVRFAPVLWIAMFNGSATLIQRLAIRALAGVAACRIGLLLAAWTQFITVFISCLPIRRHTWCVFGFAALHGVMDVVAKI
jgi:hypothetical protein